MASHEEENRLDCRQQGAKGMQTKRFIIASGLALSLGLSAQGDNYYLDPTAPTGGDGSAKARRLAPEEMSGGTFTITNLGMAGIDP